MAILMGSGKHNDYPVDFGIPSFSQTHINEHGQNPRMISNTGKKKAFVKRTLAHKHVANRWIFKRKAQMRGRTS